jgi:hypothetical protein
MSKEAKWLSDYLNEHQTGVIGFQEVFSPDAFAEVVAVVRDFLLLNKVKLRGTVLHLD